MDVDNFFANLQGKMLGPLDAMHTGQTRDGVTARIDSPSSASLASTQQTGSPSLKAVFAPTAFTSSELPCELMPQLRCSRDFAEAATQCKRN